MSQSDITVQWRMSHLYRSEFVVVKIKNCEVGTAGEVRYLGDALVLTVEMAQSQQPGAVLFPGILDEPFGDALQHLLAVQDHDPSPLGQSAVSLTLNSSLAAVLLILIKPGPTGSEVT